MAATRDGKKASVNGIRGAVAPAKGSRASQAASNGGSNGAKPVKRAMVVVAHPDDAEYGCSGTVAKWCRQGWEVVYVLCTDGSKGSEDREITSGELAEIRRQEQIEAGKILGLKDVVFLNYPDGYLTPSLELRRDIAREIRRWKPDVLVCLSPTRELSMRSYLGHPDHFASGEAALSAVYPTARDHLTFPELLKEGHEPHKVKEVWIMFLGDRADHFNPISEADMRVATKALVAHKSQVDVKRGPKMMREWRTEAGEKIGAKYAERFVVIKPRG
jgi:LmbE family N-acetylglucosaminyl deacetylase